MKIWRIAFRSVYFLDLFNFLSTIYLCLAFNFFLYRFMNGEEWYRKYNHLILSYN